MRVPVSPGATAASANGSAEERAPSTYFLHNPVAQLVKIGRTTNMRKRLRDLTNANGVALTLLGTLDGDHEREWHERFKGDRATTKVEVTAAKVLAAVTTLPTERSTEGRHGVSIRALVAHLDVSDDTVRRALKILVGRKQVASAGTNAEGAKLYAPSAPQSQAVEVPQNADAEGCG